MAHKHTRILLAGLLMALAAVIWGAAPPALAAQATINAVIPGPSSTNVRIDSTIYATLTLPNGGLDEFSVNETTVRLYTSANPGAYVPAVVNSTGGGDAINLTPQQVLAKNTQYTFEVTDGVLDGSGVAIQPFTMTFTTGTEGDPPSVDIAFTKTLMPDTVVPRLPYSSVAIGPDSRLYASTLTGQIYSWGIAADGTLEDQRVYDLYNFSRAIIGLAFDPAATASSPVMWITHNHPNFGRGDGKHFTGAIARVALNAQGDLVSNQDYVTGLPRSVGDHASNGLVFGPDGALYLTQGSISAMGAPDNAWLMEPEVLLSAAVLRIDTDAFTGAFAPPLNVATGTPQANGDLLAANNFGLGAPQLNTTYYNPQASGAPVTLFATGVRNAYDLLWHSNGQLYAPTNGSAAGGNAPGTPGTPNTACANRIDGRSYTTSVPAVNNINTRNDYLLRVEAGGYYGHPNPTRCEYVLNGGNPTASADPAEVVQQGARGGYPTATQPDPNYRGFAYDFGIGKSPNGVIEYRSNVFGGRLRGQILVVRYSANDDIIVLNPNGANGNIGAEQTNISGFTGFQNSLDLIEDTRNGNLYVAQLTNPPTGAGAIYLLKPNDIGAPQISISPRPLVLDAPRSANSAPGFFTLRNTGTEDLLINSINLTGPDAGQFQITSAPAPGTTLQPGQVASISVILLANNSAAQAGVKVANLSVTSNDPVAQNGIAQVRGLRTNGTGGSNEPSLQWVFDAFGYDIQTGDDDPTTTPITGSGARNPKPPILVGDEVPAQVFEKAGPGQVSIEPLAAYAVNTDPVTIVGWYTAGNENSKVEVFRVEQGSAQGLFPSINGATRFDPGSARFGMYSIWPNFNNNAEGGSGPPREVYSEDALNLAQGWTATNAPFGHHTRTFPLIDSSGAQVPNAYVVTVEEFHQGWDYNDVVYIMRNVRPAPVSAEIDFENRQWIGLNNANVAGMDWVNTHMTFHRHTRGKTGGWANTQEADIWDLRIHNRSLTETLVISSITLNDPDNLFDLPSYGGGTLNILPGQFYDLTVQLIEPTYTNKTARFATMTIESNDLDDPVSTVQLGAVVQDQPERGQEWSLLQMSKAFFWGTNFGNTQAVQGRYEAAGEEVLNRWWEVVDPAFPVYARQLGAFHNCCHRGADTGTLDFQTGADTNLPHGNPWGQTLFPMRGNDVNQRIPNEATVTRTGVFEFRVGNVRSCDTDGTCTGAGGQQGVRWWPIRDPYGTLVPHAFIASMDYVGGSGTNYDYNDNFFIITNVQPQNVAVDVALSGSAAPAARRRGGNPDLHLHAQQQHPLRGQQR